MTRRIDAQDAKQGKTGYPVLAVLIVSLGLAVLVWVAVEIYGQWIS